MSDSKVKSATLRPRQSEDGWFLLRVTKDTQRRKGGQTEKEGSSLPLVERLTDEYSRAPCPSAAHQLHTDTFDL